MSDIWFFFYFELCLLDNPVKRYRNKGVTIGNDLENIFPQNYVILYCESVSGPSEPLLIY